MLFRLRNIYYSLLLYQLLPAPPQIVQPCTLNAKQARNAFLKVTNVIMNKTVKMEVTKGDAVSSFKLLHYETKCLLFMML